MGKSFVDYKGFGFWTRDSYLESWLTTLLDEMEKMPKLEPWQKKAMDHWRIQKTIDGGVISVDLDELITDDTRKNFLLLLSKAALKRSDQLGYRTGELFIDLLEGKLKTTSSSPIKYLHEHEPR